MSEKRFSRVCLNKFSVLWQTGQKGVLRLGKIALLLLAGASSLSPLQASGLFKSFDIRSAIISYDINGSGKLSESSDLVIEGRASLLFDEWGARKLYKEKYIEVTTGAVKNKKTIRTLYREEHGDVYRVDFEKNRIVKGEDAVIKKAITTGENLYQKMIEELKANGQQAGRSEVLGYPCDEWLYKGKKRCFYKGVPLKEESVISGVKVIKVATSAKFDLNVSDDAFAFPEFKQDEEKGFLLKESKDALIKSKAKPEKHSEKTLSGADEREEQGSLDEALVDKSDDLAKNVFEQQKALLPKLLEEMREARVCLESVDNRRDANKCLSKLVAIEEKMSGEKSKERKIAIWTNIIREKTLDELEESILDMRRRMPCIRRSRNFEDLSRCMQDSSSED